MSINREHISAQFYQLYCLPISTEKLFLDENNLSGTIPDTIGNMNALSKLFVTCTPKDKLLITLLLEC